jgi:hypothetical protein
MTTTDTTKPKSLRQLAADAVKAAEDAEQEREQHWRESAERDRKAHAERLAEHAAMIAQRWGITRLDDDGAWIAGPADVEPDFPNAHPTRVRYVWAATDGVTLRCSTIYRPGFEHLTLVRRCAKPGHGDAGGEHHAAVSSLARLGEVLAVADPAEDSRFTGCKVCGQERAEAARAEYEAREAELETEAKAEAERRAALPPPVAALTAEPGAAEGLPRSVALAESARMLNAARKLALVDDDGLPVITASPDSYNALYAALALGYGLAAYAQACEAHVTGELEAQVQGSVHTESGY